MGLTKDSTHTSPLRHALSLSLNQCPAPGLSFFAHLAATGRAFDQAATLALRLAWLATLGVTLDVSALAAQEDWIIGPLGNLATTRRALDQSAASAKFLVGLAALRIALDLTAARAQSDFRLA